MERTAPETIKARSQMCFFLGPRSNFLLLEWLLVAGFCFFCNAFLESIANASGAFQSDNISRVLALCTKGKPLCVISEFPEFGDLFQFLRLHQASLPPSGGVQDQHNTSTSSKSSSITTATTSSEASSTGNNSVR